MRWERTRPTDAVGYRQSGEAIGERAILALRWRWFAAFVCGLLFIGFGWMLLDLTGFAWVFLSVGGIAVANGIYRGCQRTVLIVDAEGVTRSFSLPFRSPHRVDWNEFGRVLVVEERVNDGVLFAVVIERTDARRLKVFGQVWRHRSAEAVADVIRAVASHSRRLD